MDEKPSQRLAWLSFMNSANVFLQICSYSYSTAGNMISIKLTSFLGPAHFTSIGHSKQRKRNRTPAAKELNASDVKAILTFSRLLVILPRYVNTPARKGHLKAIPNHKATVHRTMSCKVFRLLPDNSKQLYTWPNMDLARRLQT